MRNLDIADTHAKLELYTYTGLLRVAEKNGVPQLPSGTNIAE